jgi:hypothetical protein
MLTQKQGRNLTNTKNRQSRKAKYCVGIDPPSGLAIWDRESQKFDAIKTVDFWKIIKTIQNYVDSSIFYIEAPQKNKPVWTKSKQTIIDKLPIYLKIAQNVGMNKMCAILIEQYCNSIGASYHLVRPGKKTMSKIKSEDFIQITGWEKKTSEHGRDAAMLVWGL